MADAQFTFSTNIAQVVQAIRDGLLTVESNVQRASAKLAATDVGGTIGTGLSNRLNAITDSFTKQVADIERSLQRQIQAQPRGGVIKGNFAAMMQAPVEAAQGQVQALMTDLSRSLQGASPGQRASIIAEAQRGVQSITAGLNEIYGEAARSVNKGRRRAGVTGLTVPRNLDIARLEGQMEQALIAGTGVTGGTAREVREARNRMAVAAGENPAVFNRAVEKRNKAVQDQARAAERLARQMEANLRPGGGYYDPRGARSSRLLGGDLMYDDRNRRFIRTDEGVQPFELPQHPTDRATFLAAERLEQERNVRESGRQQVRAAEEQKRTRARVDKEVERAQRADAKLTAAEMDAKRAAVRQIKAEENVKRRRTEMAKQNAKLDAQVERARTRDTRLTRAEVDARQQAVREARRATTGNVISRLGTEGSIEAGRFVRQADAAGRQQFFERRTIDGEVHYQRLTNSVRDQARLAAAKAATDAKSKKLADAEAKAREDLLRRQRAAASRGSGGRGGSAGIFDALLGPGPGGKGGGLFTSERLLRQGASFGGYMVSAVAFGAVIGGFAAAKEAVVDYRDSLTDLEIALDDSDRASRRLLGSLSDTARVAGANTGAAMDAAVRGIRAFSQPGDDEEQIGAQTAETASRLAVIAEKDLKDATGDVIAIASAFDLASNELTQVIDAVAVAKRELGGDAKEIAQGLAAVGVAASEVGFTLGETANLISLVQARTDQTGRAVATRLSRVFSIIGGSAGQASIQKLNKQLDDAFRIDTSGSVRDQLLQISSIYGQLTDQQQGLIRNALGGSANTRELLPILQEPERLAAALNAQFEGAGSGADEFRRKSNDIAGTLKKIRGDIEGIITGLFEAGAFDVFAIALKTAEPFLNILRETLQLYNAIFGDSQMGRFLKSGIALTLQFVAAQKLLNAAQRAGYLTSIGGGRARSGEALARADRIGGSLIPINMGRGVLWGRGGAPSRGTGPRIAPGGIAGQMYNATAFRDLPGRLGVLTMATRGLGAAAMTAAKGMAASARAFIANNPIILIVGGLLAIKSAFDTTHRVFLQVAESAEVMNRELESVTGQGLRDMATDLKNQAASNAEASGGFFGMLSEIATGNELTNQSALMEARATSLLRQAETLERESRNAARSGDPTAIIDVSTPESVADGLALIDETGGDAERQLSALYGALRRVAEGANESASALSALERLRFGIDFGDRMVGEFGETAEALSAEHSAWLDPFKREARAGRGASRIIRDNLEDEDFLRGLTDFANEVVGSMPDDSAASQAEAAAIVQQWVRANFEGWDELPADIQESLSNAILVQLRQTFNRDQAEDPQAAYDAILREGIPIAQAAAGLRANRARLTGGFGDEVEAQETLAELRKLRAQAGPGVNTDQIDNAIVEAELALQRALTARVDHDQKVAEALLSGSDAIGRHQTQIEAVKAKLELATEGGEIEQLEAELLELERQRAKLLTARASAERSARVAVGDEVGAARAEARNAYEVLQDFIEDEDTDSQEYWDAYRAYNESKHALARAEVERANARRSSRVDPRNELEQASTEIQNTIALLGATNPDSTEAENLRGQLNELRVRQQDIITATANEARLAAIDSRATVDVARIELANARASLADQSEGTKEYYSALRSVRQAELALAGAQRSLADAQDLAGIDARDTVGEAEARLRAAHRNLADQLVGTEGYYNALRTVSDAESALAATRRNLAEAQDLANIDSRSSLQGAEASLRSAERNMAAQLEGTEGFFNAMRQLRDAQQALVDAEIEYASLLRQLDIDLTDPVATTQEQLETVRERLRQARESGAAPDVVAGLEVEERNAQARAEQAAFQQRLSDARTAKELGRMSHAAYISYLESEAARLRSISNRTRQQQDMLNEVELALKAANEEMQGQFNLGDIRVPTPFEVRRAIAARTAGMGGDGSSVLGSLSRAASTTVQNTINHVTIDGTDFNAVVRYLESVLGQSAVGRRAASNTRRI